MPIKESKESKKKGPKIQLIPLKLYWFCEQTHIEKTRQKTWNKHIDLLLNKKICRYNIFNKDEILRNIEYGDYLFVAVENSKLVAFAICQDHPSPTYNIWKPNFSKRHGSFEISMICSSIPGTGQLLVNEISQFASSMLIRTQLEMVAVNSELVKHYSTNFGFVVQKGKERFSDHIPMHKKLK